jgi:AcrR family transcriptional regulator
VAQQTSGSNIHERDGAWREARAQRILDAAATLTLRFGYHKTTIHDIAKEAGVGKGTLYLHWKTRDALFTALILREKIAMADDIKRGIASDPAGATLRGLLKHAALALLRRPLLKAILLNDTQEYGALAKREQSNGASAEVLAGFMSYLQGLSNLGLVRTDLSLRAQAAIFGSIFLGFFLAAPLLPDAFRPGDEELAELMAETAHRTLEPRDPVPLGASQSAAQTLTQHLDHSMAQAQNRILGDEPPEVQDSPLNARATARARGRSGGRSRKLKTAAQVAKAQRMYADKTQSIAQICASLGISRASLYRYIKNGQADDSGSRAPIP